jgi:hypothetical protein
MPYTMSAAPAVNAASSRLDAAPAQERMVSASKRLARIAGVLHLLVIGVQAVKHAKSDERSPAAA